MADNLNVCDIAAGHSVIGEFSLMNSYRHAGFELFRTGIGKNAGTGVFLCGHVAVLIGLKGQNTAEIHAFHLGGRHMNHTGVHGHVRDLFLNDRNVIFGNFLLGRLSVIDKTDARGIGKVNGIHFAAFPLAVRGMELPVVAADVLVAVQELLKKQNLINVKTDFLTPVTLHAVVGA